jgi:hypothetical protein
MSAKAADDAGQQSTLSYSTEPCEDLRDLIWKDEIRETADWASKVELLFLDLNQGCLKRDEWLACVRTAVLSLDPSKQQAIKEQLMDLYLSASGGNSLSSKERENFAKAWIHAADARRAVVEGLGDTVQAHLDGAYTLLTLNLKIRSHREILDNKTKGRQECIEEFAKLVRAHRPVRGWLDYSDVARTLDRALVSVIGKKEIACGPLWNRDPAELIIDWLSKKKGPVYEAYRGRES